MTNTPIHRLPRDSEHSLQYLFDRECDNFPVPLTLRDVMMDLIDPSDDAKHYTIVMDWAAQIRDELGCDWASAIRVASIFYFG